MGIYSFFLPLWNKFSGCFRWQNTFRVFPAVTVQMLPELDVGQSLQTNLYKHIEFKIVVNIPNPFCSRFYPGLYCDRVYTGINTLV